MEVPKRLIIVSNRLPFQIVKKDGKSVVKQSDGGLVSALKSYFEKQSQNSVFSSTLWVGSAEFSDIAWQRLQKKKIASLPFNIEPLFFDRKSYNSYYNGFCNATLWPLFHYFPSFVEFDNETFRAYEYVNNVFAEKILSILTDDDVVWIHDYQLMLLPGLIRQRRPDATIGFFLHIPFPSFEVFRMLHRPWKEKILNGLLGADLIGFHTHEYVQHFLKTVQMVKGYDHQFRSIFLPTRIVKAEMFPLGIDYEKFNQAILEPEVSELSKSATESFANRKIIFSVDRLDYTKGINHRLAGFERFLEMHPEWIEKVVFILVVVPSRQIVSRYNERKKIIEEEIGRINGRYSTLQWQPIIYRYNNLSFTELTAMYYASDVALITPLRDGMNLVAKEFIATKGDKGVLILSELAGAANELSEAVLVNPMDRAEVSDGILTAVTMPEHVQKSKLEKLKHRLKDYNVVDWMNDFIGQLEEIKRQQQLQATKHVNEELMDKIADHFRISERRLLLLDYDGTLVPFSKLPHLAIPDRKVIELLQYMSADERTHVAIISGRDSCTLEEWFGNLPITLIAEHGGGIKEKSGEWRYFLKVDQSWKRIFRPTLEMFTRRSPGSFIEEKKHTLVWHYRNVESELGFIRSRELLDNVHHMIRNSHLHVIDGNKVIEIRMAGIDKGAITRKLVDEIQYDFILAVGDDKTDEDMFRILDNDAYTIKMGSGHTTARYNMNEQEELLALLKSFAKASAMVPDLP
jgi:trehalose 6-phosphate synthase/phosphatase